MKDEEMTDEEREMLYTLSVNLDYFAKETARGQSFYQYGKKADDYADILLELKSKRLLTIEMSQINVDMLLRIMQNIDNTIKDMQKGYVLEKCTFMCKRCDYLQYCKYNKEIK